MESNPLLPHKADRQYTESNVNLEARDALLNSFLSARGSVAGCMIDIDVKELEAFLSQEEASDATYWALFHGNRPYSLYIASYFCARAGEWFTYVAMITAIRHICPDSNTAVAGLVAVKMVPNIVFASIGGVLADTMDRRVAMIILDIIGMLVVLLYIPVYHLKSLPLLYLVAFIQATVASIYDTVRRAIVPLLVPQEDYLQKATTMSGIVYSLMAAFGSSLGGIVASKYGVTTCFVIDSFTYVLSASLMWLVGGKWSVAKQTLTSRNPFQLIGAFIHLTGEGIKYLSTSSLALIVFLKSSGSITFGCADVLNVELSHLDEDEAGDGKRLGLLFAMTGFGILIGPLFAERFVTMKQPRSILRACVISLGLLSFSFAGIGSSSSFRRICFFTVVRGAATGTLIINASLLLQKITRNDMYGRVLSVDLMLTTFFSTVSAFAVGALEDMGMSPEDVSLAMAFIGFLIFVAWGYYFLRERESL